MSIFGTSAPSAVSYWWCHQILCCAVHLFHRSPSRIPPVVLALDYGTRSPDVLRKVLPSAKREVVVSSVPWFEYFSPPLVQLCSIIKNGFPLSYEGWCGYTKIMVCWRVRCSAVAFFGSWWLSYGWCHDLPVACAELL
jgi:hypothetical protein